MERNELKIAFDPHPKIFSAASAWLSLRPDWSWLDWLADSWSQLAIVLVIDHAWPGLACPGPGCPNSGLSWSLFLIPAGLAVAMDIRVFFLHMFLNSNLPSYDSRSNADPKTSPFFSFFIFVRFVILWFLTFSRSAHHYIQWGAI